jgi:hypothetical protein
MADDKAIACDEAAKVTASQQQRRGKCLLAGAVALVVLLIAFIAVARLVPGPVTRDVVAHSVSRSLEATGTPKCEGPVSALRCELEDGSGTRATYLVTTSKSCWHAALENPAAGVEMAPEAHRCMHVHLWDNIFS